jgi:hypothetical protein
MACSVWLIPKKDTGMTLKWVCQSDDELDQVKSLGATLSTKSFTNISKHEQDRTTVSDDTCSSKSADLTSVRNSGTPSAMENNTPATKQPVDNTTSKSTRIVKVPFYEPSTLLTHVLVLNRKHFILASRSCIVLVVLPSVAYVYHNERTEWKSIVFNEAVISCCLVQGTKIIMILIEIHRCFEVTRYINMNSCPISFHCRGYFSLADF